MQGRWMEISLHRNVEVFDLADNIGWLKKKN